MVVLGQTPVQIPTPTRIQPAAADPFGSAIRVNTDNGGNFFKG